MSAPVTTTVRKDQPTRQLTDEEKRRLKADIDRLLDLSQQRLNRLKELKNEQIELLTRL